MRIRLVRVATSACIVVLPAVATAQPAPGGRSLDLATMQQAAVDTDPRLRQLTLLAAQSELRVRNLVAARLPSIGVEGQAQYQSDVPRSPAMLPGGGALFAPPKATYDSALRIDQRIFDQTIGAQDAVERAQLAEQQARVRATLFAVRQRVNDEYFAAAALEARAAALASTVADLDARLQETAARVREGTALPAEAAAIEATLLSRREDEEELRANRRAAIGRLSTLTGQTVTEDDVLGLPDLASLVARAREAPDAVRSRPEYEQFARTRERIARQRDAVAAGEHPRVSTYAKVGYGSPGLNFVSDEFESYGLAGVRVEWNAWRWGTANREREALAIQQQLVSADEAAFAKGIGEAIEGDEAAIDRLQSALAMDDRIVLLREQVERSTQARFQEGVVTASEYLDRTSELLQARFARAGHQVDLAQAGARLLTTLGLDVR